MQSKKETLIAWLRDAHAMERATIDNIDRLVDRMSDYPAFCEKYREHGVKSRAQLERIDRALAMMGADSSGIKDTVMRMMGFAEAYATAVADDEAVKHCLAACGYENFEIASYISLIAAAQTCGEMEIKALCETSLKEEREMAAWLEQYIPIITSEFLTHDDPARSGAAVDIETGRRL